MRTTVRLNDELLKAAKRLAARTDRTLTAVIEDALREALARTNEAETRPAVELRAVPGRPRPGITLDRTADLIDAMEET